MTKHSPFRYFKTSPEIIRLAVMLYVRFPLSLRNVEDLLHSPTVLLSQMKIYSAQLLMRRLKKAFLKNQKLQLWPSLAQSAVRLQA
ncbi:hypothetical protein N8Z44_03285, partial [Planktomarina temperata]|nr:hypothetical protein [Planktomarina temperata]